MKHLLIVGAGGQCRSVISIVNSMDAWKIEGIIDTAFKGQKEIVMGVSVIGGLEKLKSYRGKGYSLVLAIGDNIEREKVAGMIPLDNFSLPNIIHCRAQVESSAQLGVGNVIGCYAFVGPDVVTGSFNIINTASVVEHEVRIGSFNHISPSATVCGRAEICDTTLIGTNASVLPGISLASNTKLGANSLMNKSVLQENLTLVGNPATKR